MTIPTDGYDCTTVKFDIVGDFYGVTMTVVGIQAGSGLAHDAALAAAQAYVDYCNQQVPSPSYGPWTATPTYIDASAPGAPITASS
jgi:hypothetical protein